MLAAAREPLSINRIATELGVHPNTVRFHLDTLEQAGRVEVVPSPPQRPGRPARLYRARKAMDRGGARNYRVLAEILLAGLGGAESPAAQAVAAGRAWGRERAHGGDGHGIDGLIKLLDELGFAPDRPATDHVDLRHCPFLELAEDRARVVCPVHLGLMQGALAEWRAPVTVDRLEPFVEPDRCVAHLAPAGTAP